MRSIAVTLLILVPLVARADIADELERYVGYTITKSSTIAGYKDKGGKKSDEFEGCDFDRRIYLDDGTVLTCASYNYTYSFRPTAIVLTKSLDVGGRKTLLIVMIVEDEVYEMEPILIKQ